MLQPEHYKMLHVTYINTIMTKRYMDIARLRTGVFDSFFHFVCQDLRFERECQLPNLLLST